MATRKRHAAPRGGLLYDAAAERRENIIGQRIAEARKRRGLSLAALQTLLARHGLTIQRQGIGKWEQGVAVPNAYQLLALCHALQIEDGVAWFTGSPAPALNTTGLEKLRDYRADLVASGRYRPAVPTVKLVDMPVSTLAVSAGTGAFLDEDSFETVSFPASAVPDGADFGVRVRGDSMEPVYHDGQIVWVRQCQSLRPGDTGVFLYDGEGYIKVYGEQTPEDPAAFTDSIGVLHMQPVLISYNEAYGPRPVSPELPFSIVGQVLT